MGTNEDMYGTSGLVGPTRVRVIMGAKDFVLIDHQDDFVLTDHQDEGQWGSQDVLSPLFGLMSCRHFLG